VLTVYETRVKQLLQNPAAPTALYATSDIDGWINEARGQVAGEGECVRRIGTLTTAIGTRPYNFSGIAFTDTSVAGAIHVRRISYNVASGQKVVYSRAWEWFDLYLLNNPVPVNGPPARWAQYGQGSAGAGSITGIGAGSMSSGSFYLDPPPDALYGLNLDCCCYPVALTADTDVECLPYLWTDAVPYFAAYLALLSSQTNARMADAERMFGYYQTFMKRARQFANPSVDRFQYEQAGDPVQLTKLGQQAQRAAG
jgi:hypothetical protein